MNNYLLLGACFILGILLRRSGQLPDNAAAALNGFVVHISLPALTLTYVHGLKLQPSLILPALILGSCLGSHADSSGWPGGCLVFHALRQAG
jgi:predicted permease